MTYEAPVAGHNKHRRNLARVATPPSFGQPSSEGERFTRTARISFKSAHFGPIRYRAIFVSRETKTYRCVHFARMRIARMRRRNVHWKKALQECTASWPPPDSCRLHLGPQAKETRCSLAKLGDLHKDLIDSCQAASYGIFVYKMGIAGVYTGLFRVL